METVVIEIKVLNDVMSKLASMPYGEVVGLIQAVHQSVDKCSKPKENVPVKNVPAKEA